MNLRRVLKKIVNLGSRLNQQFNPAEQEFKRKYPLINSVEGFLKSPKQERWFFMAAKKAPKDAVIVEIGSYKGRSTVSFGFGCIGTKKHVYAIDLFEGDGKYYGDDEFQKIFQSNVERCMLTKYITPIKAKSLEVASKWNKPIDILFIDGSHEYEDVKADFEAFYPFVKEGGIIALHDIKGAFDGVIRFWGEVINADLLKDTGQVSSLGFGVKK